MPIVTIDVAQIILVLGIIGILIAVLFFNKEAHERLRQLLKDLAEALGALIKLLNKK